MAVFEEAVVTTDKNQAILKNMIRAMYKCAEVNRNDNYVIMLTNNQNPFETKTRGDERRLKIFNVPPQHKGSREYWNRLYQWLNCPTKPELWVVYPSYIIRKFIGFEGFFDANYPEYKSCFGDREKFIEKIRVTEFEDLRTETNIAISQNSLPHIAKYVITIFKDPKGQGNWFVPNQYALRSTVFTNFQHFQDANQFKNHLQSPNFWGGPINALALFCRPISIKDGDVEYIKKNKIIKRNYGYHVKMLTRDEIHKKFLQCFPGVEPSEVDTTG